jgi:hypothetical protein
MPSLFASLATSAKVVTFAVSAEPAEIRPMARVGPNGAASVDPTRSITPISVIFAEHPAELFDSARVASYSPTPSAVVVPVAVFETAALGGLVLVAGRDRIVRTSTGEAWILAERLPDGLGGESWRLAAASA